MKKKISSILLIVLSLSMILSACGQTAPSTSSSEGDAETSSGSDENKESTEEVLKAPESDEKAFEKFPKPVDVHIGMAVDATDTSLPKDDSAGNNKYTRYLKENFNINVIVDWTASGEDYRQKVSLAIASNSLPDGVVAPDRSYMMKAAESDMLYDITDLYKTYSSSQIQGIIDATDGRAMDNSSYDGKMVALPHTSDDADGIHTVHIRKDWLDELGLEIPKTISDIEDIAKAFKEAKLAGDATIPIGAMGKSGKLYCTFLESGNNMFGFDPIFSAMDSYPGFWLEENGEIIYGTTQEQTKDTIEILNRWYKEGLIDPEIGTKEQPVEDVNSGNTGMFFGPWWSVGYGASDVFKNTPDADWQSFAILDDSGNWNTKMKDTGVTYTIINKDASEDAAAAIIKMYSIIARDEAMFGQEVAKDWYPLVNNAAASDEVTYTALELVKVLNGETSPEDYNDPTSIYKHIAHDTSIVKDVIVDYTSWEELGTKNISLESFGDAQRMHAQLIGARPYASIKTSKEVLSKTYVTTETMTQKWSNLKKLEDEAMLKMILGQEDISYFDTFVTEWHKQGGDEIIAEVKDISSK